MEEPPPTALDPTRQQLSVTLPPPLIRASTLLARGRAREVAAGEGAEARLRPRPWAPAPLRQGARRENTAGLTLANKALELGLGSAAPPPQGPGDGVVAEAGTRGQLLRPPSHPHLIPRQPPASEGGPPLPSNNPSSETSPSAAAELAAAKAALVQSCCRRPSAQAEGCRGRRGEGCREGERGGAAGRHGGGGHCMAQCHHALSFSPGPLGRISTTLVTADARRHRPRAAFRMPSCERCRAHPTRSSATPSGR